MGRIERKIFQRKFDADFKNLPSSKHFYRKAFPIHIAIPIPKFNPPPPPLLACSLNNHGLYRKPQYHGVPYSIVVQTKSN